MGNSSDSLRTCTSRWILTWGNETATRSGMRVREVGVREDVYQVSSRASGRTRPNRTMIRQKEIPTAGPDCGGLAG